MSKKKKIILAWRRFSKRLLTMPILLSLLRGEAALRAIGTLRGEATLPAKPITPSVP
jgi:hypothetical protein